MVATPATATGGRTYYGALHGTEVQAERNVELASWIYEDNGDATETRWGIGPWIGMTDRLELGFPIELAKVGAGATELERYGVELRYRLVVRDTPRPVVPLVRLAITRVVATHDTATIDADVVISYESGRLHLLVDAGVSALVGPGGPAWKLRPGAGASIRVSGTLRFGVEVFAEVPLERAGEATAARSTIGDPEVDSGSVAVGPDIAWTHGRFWVSAVIGIGIVGIESAPRLSWGIAF